jgi:hypothetical protein
VQQLLNRRLVPFRGSGFEFLAGRAKAGAAHQMGHQTNLLVSHFLAPFV